MIKREEQTGTTFSGSSSIFLDPSKTLIVFPLNALPLNLVAIRKNKVCRYETHEAALRRDLLGCHLTGNLQVVNHKILPKLLGDNDVIKRQLLRFRWWPVLWPDIFLAMDSLDDRLFQ